MSERGTGETDSCTDPPGPRYIGYAQTVGGSIVANEGFIRQFATVTDPETGERVLDANHVSTWGAVTFAAQIVVQLLSGYIADRWGRKANMWLLQLVLTAVGELVSCLFPECHRWAGC